MYRVIGNAAGPALFLRIFLSLLHYEFLLRYSLLEWCVEFGIDGYFIWVIFQPNVLVMDLDLLRFLDFC